MKTMLLITSAVGASLLWASAAQAQTMRCFPLEGVDRVLTERGEQLAVEGMVRGHEHRFRLYINPETGDWTGVLVRGDGPACPMIAGTDLGPVEAEEAEPPLDPKSPGGNNERDQSSYRNGILHEVAP